MMQRVFDGMAKQASVEFLCFKSFLPGKKTLGEFYRFIDLLADFGYNALMLEIGGAMEYEKHPEINTGWEEYSKICDEFNGKRILLQRSYIYPKDSIHTENGEGSYLTKQELKAIAAYCADQGIEIIPEVPCFSHADYLLYPHPEFAECPDEPLPTNACPSNEGYYALLFDVLDEVIEVFAPKRINICHDEAYVYGQCPRCKEKSAAELFGGHIVRVHDYLEKQGVKTMIWGDGIIPTWHGGNAAMHRRYPWDGKRTVTVKDKVYEVHNFSCHSMEDWAKIKEKEPDATGWFVAEKSGAMDMMPSDLEVMNWSWGVDAKSDGYTTEKGLYQVYGNFQAIQMKNLKQRLAAGVSGYSYSHWGRADLATMQYNGALFGMAYNSLACHDIAYDESKREKNIQTASDAVYHCLNKDVLSGKHLRVVHTTDAMMEHVGFYDGYQLEQEAFMIGSYEVVYADQSKESFPIYWGYNIGNAYVVWDASNEKNKRLMEDGSYHTKHIFEPIGASRPIISGAKTWYETVFPVRQDVTEVALRSCDGVCIELKEWSVEE